MYVLSNIVSMFRFTYPVRQRYEMKKRTHFNDPIYESISCNKWEKNIIDHPLFQRLALIKQLTCVDTVFRSGLHNRFTHCMGVMHLAGKYAKRLFEGYNEKERQHIIQVARLSGLLHDIGHGPGSHAYDSSVYKIIYPGVEKGHDIHRNVIVREGLTKEIRECGVDPEELIDVWEGRNIILKAILNGPIGADRLDFLNRDAYMCNTRQFACIPYKRLVDAVLIAERDGVACLHYKKKVANDITQALTGRFFQYESVYFHPVVGGAQMLIEEMIAAAVKPLNLVEITKDMKQFHILTDPWLDAAIDTSKDTSPDMLKAKSILARLRARDLPKMVCERSIGKGELKTFQKEGSTIEEAAKAYIEETVIKHFTDKSIPWNIKVNRGLSPVQPSQFNKDSVYIWTKDKRSITYYDFLKESKFFSRLCDPEIDEIILIRLYCDKEYKEAFASQLASIPTTIPQINNNNIPLENPQSPSNSDRKVGVGVGVLVKRGNSILLGKRLSSGRQDGSWAPPGGHLEFGESFERCAQREVKEETDIDVPLENIKIVKLLSDADPDGKHHYVSIVLTCNVPEETEPKAMEPDKCNEWKWFDISDNFKDMPSPLFSSFRKSIQEGLSI